MTENRTLTHTIADKMPGADPLLLNPVFINLLAKAETHQFEFRPKETARLEKQNQLAPVLLERTKNCWETMIAARQSGHTQSEAQEIALPIILLPDETDQE